MTDPRINAGQPQLGNHETAHDEPPSKSKDEVCSIIRTRKQAQTSQKQHRLRLARTRFHHR
ncbi:Hypothetical predicted protein [Pelobates cultripes]|uniref:Uncharacterized protein n=1 Tax=Pelobates cultripes TaxID=61616 RepID=A0AAD1W0S9_PELCU|nr:Hypothetical predicted protein [Pelobates cultripes]